MKGIRQRTFFLALGFGVLLFLALLGMQITSSPEFCGTCHIMRPYYESWKTSTHNRFACVECHIPPGLGSEFRKKYEALSMVVRYFTGTYSTNPWTEIEDAACLRCHDKRLIQGKELFGKVIFDHTPHLLELRRGKRLRCTSCHSQIVQGKHITATASTCFLCHFKDQKPGEGTARCELCHTPPDTVVTAQGVQFNHGDVQRFGMDCAWCHAKSIRGNGEVPRERCLTCHNEPARLARYGETELLHRIHVTDHKVECLSCHLEIRHGAIELEPAATPCEKCHLSGHEPTRDLYAGLGGKGVPPTPSPMFLTGITCEGCHFLPDTAAHGGLKKANEVSCMACHGTRYRKVFFFWKRAIEQAEKQVARALQKVSQTRQASLDLRDALANLRLVQRGGAIHNPEYALALLGWTYNTLRTQIGNGLPPWPEIPYETTCRSCHLNIPFRTASFRDYRFSHTRHVSVKGIRCDTCHRPHEEKPRGELLRPDLACASCHHKPSVQKSCPDCHGQGPELLTLRDGREFPHAYHVGEDVELACLDCHAPSGRVSFSICEDCHE